jgi:hypothetical protein
VEGTWRGYVARISSRFGANSCKTGGERYTRVSKKQGENVLMSNCLKRMCVEEKSGVCLQLGRLPERCKNVLYGGAGMARCE